MSERNKTNIGIHRTVYKESLNKNRKNVKEKEEKGKIKANGK
jgi:hypothetical protein